MKNKFLMLILLWVTSQVIFFTGVARWETIFFDIGLILYVLYDCTHKRDLYKDYLSLFKKVD